MSLGENHRYSDRQGDNINPRTGLPFGTIYANNCAETQDLLEQIIEHGRNLSQELRNQELLDGIQGAINDFFTEHAAELASDPQTDEEANRDNDRLTGLTQQLTAAIRTVVANFTSSSERVVEQRHVAELMEGLSDSATNGGQLAKDVVEQDAKDLVSALENHGLWDCFESDEDTYKLVENTPHGHFICEAGVLGGAYLLTVIESPWVAWCRPCSPCVPNSGDLGHLAEHEYGMLAYCLPPEHLPEDRRIKAIRLT
jgi:hypothetical protein